jgi:hypothetical protein
MKTLNGQLTSVWAWLTADPVRMQLAVILAAALVMLALAALASGGQPVPIAGPSGGGSGGSG